MAARRVQSHAALGCACFMLLGCNRKPESLVTPTSPPSTSGAPSSESSASAPQQPAVTRMGERGVARHYAMSFGETKECALEPHFRPAAGTIKLGVHVTIEAFDSLQVPANPFYATLIDSNNVAYETTLAGCQPALRASQLARGQKASGWITFEIPKQAHGLRLAYAPALVGTGRDELLFALDR